MNTAERKLYDVLHKELNFPDAAALAYLEAAEDFWEFKMKQATNTVATKEDIRGLEMNVKDDIRRLELQLETIKEDNHRLELKIREDISKMEINLERRVSDNKSDIYKAIFFTGLVQFLAIMGGVIAIVKFMMK